MKQLAKLIVVIEDFAIKFVLGSLLTILVLVAMWVFGYMIYGAWMYSATEWNQLSTFDQWWICTAAGAILFGSIAFLIGLHIWAVKTSDR